MNIISENTVVKMADAMDTTDACTLAIEVKHGPKSLINIISTFEMKMMPSEVFDAVSKDLQEGASVGKRRGPVTVERHTPSEKLSPLSDFQIRYIHFWVRQEDFILLYTVETQKFYLEHCKIKADFTLNVLLVRISVL